MALVSLHPNLNVAQFRSPGNRIFIIEGLFTVLVGVVSKWWITDWPETASFLNDDERSLLLARLAQDTGEAKS